jgi:hypothetical protein
MEIAKLYETAAEKLDKAIEVCEKSNISLTSITVIAAASGNIYSAPNWKRLNDDFEEEETHSEDEALAKMLLAGETAVEHIVTLDAKTKLPVDPYQKSLETLVKINTENAKCNILQGKNSKVVLTSVNSDIAKFAEQITAEEAKNKASVNVTEASPDQNADSNAASVPHPPVTPGPGEPEGSAAHAGIDASGLQMIFDDWESSADKQDGNESKPFNGQSLSSSQADKAEVINQVQNMANNGYTGGQMQNGMYQQQQSMNGGQMQNGMYGQGMNGMYGGQMQGGMYQQQSMNGGQMQNGMYGQGMNGMYGGQMQGGMYGQGMNGMYGGQMNGMYGGPMNGMYGGQMYGQQSVNGPMYGGQGGAYGQQPNGGRQSLYLNPAANQGTPGQQSVYTMPGSATSSYRSKLQAPVHSSVVNTQSVSVYGTNIGEGDNNAIFKDRLADILNSSSAAGKADENDKTEVMMSAKEKKNAAKKDAKHH